MDLWKTIGAFQRSKGHLVDRREVSVMYDLIK